MLQVVKRRWLNPIRRSALNLIYRYPPPSGRVVTAEYIGGGHVAGARYERVPPHPDDAETGTPELFLATIPGGRVYGEGAVITPDNLALEDVYLDFGSDALGNRIIRGPRLPQPKRLELRLGVVTAPASKCYFHWLFDIVPRLELLRGAAVDLLYLDTRKPFQREYLSLLEIAGPRVLPARRRAHYEAAELVVPSLPGRTGRVTYRTCHFLRSLLSRVDVPVDRPRRRIYISRADAKRRRIVNESEFWSQLQQRGFERVTLSNLPVVEQIQLFASAAEIVAPHGAGLSNLVFAAPGTRVVEIAAPTYVKHCFRDLATCCDLKHCFVIGAAAGRTQSDPLRQDICVDPRQVLGRLK